MPRVIRSPCTQTDLVALMTECSLLTEDLGSLVLFWRVCTPVMTLCSVAPFRVQTKRKASDIIEVRKKRSCS